MDRVKRVIHCDRAYKMGLNGKNITVAVMDPVSYTHLRAHETDSYLVCRLLLEKKKKKTFVDRITMNSKKTSKATQTNKQ